MRRSVRAAAVLALLATSAQAEEKPLWEFGLGVGALDFPDYRGSDETQVYPVPVPYFVYRGRFLKADRDGLRGKLFDREYVELSLSVNATIPVDSEDNAARTAACRTCKPTIELGPSLEWHLWRSTDRAVKLDLVMPLRVPITLESSPRSLHWVFAPRLNIHFENVGGRGWEFGGGVGPVFAADKFHEYFYSVPARFATAGRPEYHADGGYSGMHVLAGAVEAISEVLVRRVPALRLARRRRVRGQPADAAPELAGRRLRHRVDDRRVASEECEEEE